MSRTRSNMSARRPSLPTLEEVPEWVANVARILFFLPDGFCHGDDDPDYRDSDW